MLDAIPSDGVGPLEVGRMPSTGVRMSARDLGSTYKQTTNIRGTSNGVASDRLGPVPTVYWSDGAIVTSRCLLLDRFLFGLFINVENCILRERGSTWSLLCCRGISN